MRVVLRDHPRVQRDGIGRRPSILPQAGLVWEHARSLVEALRH
jgi:hypothetical protein